MTHFSNNNDSWHYSRAALADKALNAFDPGPAAALTIFERRRMGKTEFLRKDLMPIAQSRGWKVFYMSFLGISEPENEFVSRLNDFAGEGKFLENFQKIAAKTVAASPVKKIKIPGAEIELQTPPKPTEKLSDLFSAINKQFPKTLLLLDEIQTLATGTKSFIEKNRFFIGALRTGLDMHKDRIKAVFTGSSQNGLHRMFSDHGTAFYRYASAFEIPKMGQNFTDFLCRNFEKAGGRKIDADTFCEIFAGKLGHNPALARRIMDKMIIYPSFSLEDAAAQVLRDDRQDYSRIWESLTGLQQVILTYIAQGGARPYSKKSTTILSGKIGVELTSSGIQAAINKMTQGTGESGDILTKIGTSQYVFQDESFKDFIEKGIV